jgi:DUF1365 family protein
MTEAFGNQMTMGSEARGKEGSMPPSAIYAGTVMHRRLRPAPHVLQYGMFTLLLDLEEVPRLASRLRWFSLGRANLFAWRPQDHLSGGNDLRGEVDGILERAGMDPDGGSVHLLTMPRVLGYVFNPISVYTCHRAGGALQAVLYEVNNTFGDRHSYLFPVGDFAVGGGTSLRHSCAKALHVSPFVDMGMRYDFRLRPPTETFGLRIDVSDGDGPLLVAAERLRRRPLTDRELLRGFLEFPLQSLKVIAGIHYEAFHIWRKGVVLRRRPPPPSMPVSVMALTTPPHHPA